ncbi:MAG: hypothetical protein HKN42_04655 [Granulosicoccus sp.]|nr:hypothetical protein [Granulosicoccus sp.]
MKAFLICMIIALMLMVSLVAGVWFYMSTILKREADVASIVLPNLELAHQFTSATAGLQSQGLLMRNADSIEALHSRQQLLEDSISRTRELIDSGSGRQDIDASALANTIDQIHVVMIALADIREAELNAVEQLHEATESILGDLDLLIAAIQSRVVLLTGKLQEQGDVLADYGGAPADLEARSGVHDSTPSQFVSLSLYLQDYLLASQDLVRLRALVQRMPLLRAIDDVATSEQQRDLLLRTLVSRAARIEDDKVEDVLLTPLKDVSNRLHARHNPFMNARNSIELSELQQRLNTALTGLTDEVPAVAEHIRSQSESILVEVSMRTREELKRYRRFLFGVLGLSLLAVGCIAYWLLYRRTALPLSEISSQLDSVGTDGFSPVDQDYFLLELAELSTAVNELDQAHKEMQRKDLQLKDTNRELCRVNEELEQFAHVASHDLQEPLRKLQQFSGLLEEEYGDQLGDDGRFYVDAITRSASRMSAMIRDTLEYARSSRSSQTISTVDLEKLLDSVRADKEFVIEEAGATICIGDLPLVEANQTGMVQLFGNLLVNAVKYRRPDTACVVRIDAHYPAGEQRVVITVEDNGMGIDNQHLQRVFSPFERLGGGAVAGTGLGLAICARVCEAHGWSIEVSSEVGVGSCFRISVPLAHVVTFAQAM